MVRVWDAELPTPICGDTFASRFVDERSREIWERFRRFKYPNASNAVRHRIIDDYLRREIGRQSDISIFIIGCGFDTRPFRFPGGRWVELDDASILDYKEARLPVARSRNSLSRVAIDFTTESLEDKLRPFATSEHVIVIVEGVSMYLSEQQTRNLAFTLKTVFPQHTLYCDLMRRSFIEKYGGRFRQAIHELGATFGDLVQAPETRLTKEGYRADGDVSIPLRGAELAGGVSARFLLNNLLTGMRDGYKVWRFRMANQES
jgi:O-methyltransferase involved in polyketide biosynthesis